MKMRAGVRQKKEQIFSHKLLLSGFQVQAGTITAASGHSAGARGNDQG
jgi:hypothetical protein